MTTKLRITRVPGITVSSVCDRLTTVLYSVLQYEYTVEANQAIDRS